MFNFLNYHINVEGLQIIEDSESLQLKAYLDTGKVPTIGYGHTKGVKLGMTCSKEQAIQWLKEDVKIAEDSVKRLVKVELTENQFSALVDFEFNTGSLGKSTLLKKLNACDVVGASKEFDRWVFDNGKKQGGLVIRRDKDEALFLRK